MRKILTIVLVSVLLPLAFFGIFGLCEILPFDTVVRIETRLQDPKSLTLTYRADDRFTTAGPFSVTDAEGDAKILSFRIPRENTGIYSINMGKGNTTVGITGVVFYTGLTLRRLDCVETAVIFSSLENAESVLSTSKGVYNVTSEGGGGVLTSVRPPVGRVITPQTFVFVGVGSLILAVIVAVLVASLWKGKGKARFIPFFFGIALCVILALGVVIGGFPEFEKDHSVFETDALLEYRKEAGLKDKDAEDEADPEADAPAEDTGNTGSVYDDTVFYPMSIGSGSSRDEQNQPKVTEEELHREGFVYDNVHVGKTDHRGITWYFYGDEAAEFSGAKTVNNRELARMTDKLTQYAEALKASGIEFYVVICPNKSTVYPEYVPDNVTWLESSYTVLDKVYDHLSENTDINLIDIRPALEKAKSEDFPLYYEYDTHWNNYGGFAAYGAIMDAISRDFPSVRVRRREDYRVELSASYMKDQLWYLGYYNRFDSVGPVFTPLEPSGTYLDTVTPNTVSGIFAYQYVYPDGFVDWNKYCRFVNPSLEASGAPSAYVIRDSFGISLTYFLRESFSESIFSLTHGTLPSLSSLKAAGTDIVIYQVAERNLDAILSQ